jgi:hypothetical protein
MICATVRTSAVSRLSAFVLLLLMASPLAATSSTTPGPFEATIHVAESTRNEAAPPDVLVEPLASLGVETAFEAASLETPLVATTAFTQTHQVLRL